MKKNIVIILLLCLFTILATYPLIRHLGQGIYSTSDQLFYAWLIDRNISAFTAKPLSSFFDANVFFPYHNTLAFGDHMLAETILAYPFYMFGRNPIFAENVLIFSSFVFTGYGMYLLAGRHTNNTFVRLFAGTAFAFSHVRFNQYDHLNILFTQWFPFMLYFLDQWFDLRKIRHLLLFALCYGLSVLSTVYYLLMGTMLVIVYVAGLLLFRQLPRDRLNKKSIAGVLIAILFVVLLTLPTFLPYVTFSQQFPQVKRVLSDNIIYSATPASYVESARTTKIAELIGVNHKSESDIGLFPGFLVLLLVIYSFISYKKLKDSKFLGSFKFYLTLSVFFFLLSFGPVLKLSSEYSTSLPLPYLLLYYIFPPIQVMRVPARFAIFSELFLVLSATIGFLLFLQDLKKKLPQKWYIVIASSIIAISIFESWSVPLDLVLVETKQDFPQVYRWLKDQPDTSIILELPVPDGAARDGQRKVKTRYAFLEELTSHDKDTIEAFRMYFSLLHGKRMVNGYSAFTPPIYNEIVTSTQSFPDDSSLAKLRQTGITYIVVHLREYPKEKQTDIIGKLTSRHDLNLVKQFDKDYVFEVL